MNTAIQYLRGLVVDVSTLKFRRTAVKVVYAVLAIVIIYVAFFRGGAAEEMVVETPTPSVKVASVRSMVSGSSFTAVGSVSAVSEARLQTEAGGRITAVTVSLGDAVAAGTILARMESAAESASLLQAQGAYEAALAGAAQGGVGINEAKNAITAAENGAVTTYKNAYTSVSGVVFGTLDKYFANPNGQIPGVRLGGSNSSALNSSRISLQNSLPAWQTKSTSLTASGDLTGALNEAEKTTKLVLEMTDMFITNAQNEKGNSLLSEEEFRAIAASLNVTRGQLVGILASIDGARTGLNAAKENANRAQIAGSGPTVSSADAQVKIALGSLRAAQANYERTLVRTPIAGVVNALYLKTGEYANPGAPAAIVANKNNGLEISTSVSQEESVRIKVGDMVTIDGTATGTIATIAGAIDPTTGKVALKISAIESTNLQNGSTVSIDFATQTVTEMTDIVIPLSAIKMTGTGPVVFTVGNETKLVGVPVVLGAINGEFVTVESGVTLETIVVVDARGLKEGTVVTLATK